MAPSSLEYICSNLWTMNKTRSSSNVLRRRHPDCVKLCWLLFLCHVAALKQKAPKRLRVGVSQDNATHSGLVESDAANIRKFNSQRGEGSRARDTLVLVNEDNAKERQNPIYQEHRRKGKRKMQEIKRKKGKKKHQRQEATRNPTSNPTPNPTATPTAKPTASPTKDPSSSPSASPTESPSAPPSSSPSAPPTYSPSVQPTNFPSSSPTGCSCPKQIGGFDDVWNARVLVDLTGAPTILSTSQLNFYLEELRKQMEEAFNLRCPENAVEVDPILFAGQAFSNTSSAPLFRGRRLADGTNQVDQFVSARYRTPPPQPNFSELSLYAIDSDGSAPSRRELSHLDAESIIYEGHPRYIGGNFEDPALEVDWAEHSIKTYNETDYPQQQEEGVSHTYNEGFFLGESLPSYRTNPQASSAPQIKRNHIGGSSVPGVYRTPEEGVICQPSEDFLTRLRAQQDAYFEQVEKITALVLEGSFSFSFDFGFDAGGLLETSFRNNRKLWWR
jgi:hypothetical protein